MTELERIADPRVHAFTRRMRLLWWLLLPGNVLLAISVIYGWSTGGAPGGFLRGPGPVMNLLAMWALGSLLFAHAWVLLAAGVLAWKRGDVEGKDVAMLAIMAFLLLVTWLPVLVTRAAPVT